MELKMSEIAREPIAAEIVRQLWEAMQRRDWAEAAMLVAPSADVWWPVTNERFTGETYVAMNQAYPEGWTIRIEDVLAHGKRAAARVAVDQGGERYWCFGFYSVDAGRISSAVESWVAGGSESPPDWRKRFRQ